MSSVSSQNAYQPDEDDQRMIRFQSGDKSAFNEIVNDWQRPLWRFFCHHTRDPACSEDLTQIAFTRLSNNAWNYIPCGLFRTFIFRIARNLLIDKSRRDKSDVLIRSPQSAAGEPDYLTSIPSSDRTADEIAQDRELSNIIESCILKLPEEQRTTFWLFHSQALSLPEIAAATDVGLSTAKSRLRLAREKLRSMLFALDIGCDWPVKDHEDDN